MGEGWLIRAFSFSEGILTTPFGEESYSDPNKIYEGERLVRSWGESGSALVLLSEHGQEKRLIGGSQDQPSVGDFNGEWIVWSMGSPPAIWALFKEGEDNRPFQISEESGPQRQPLLAGSRVVWLDEGSAPHRLLSFDLETGLREEITRGAIGRGDFAADSQRLIWLQADAEGEHDLFMRRWSPLLASGLPPEDVNPADLGVEDAGPVDFGVEDADPVDLGVGELSLDAGPIDLGVQDTGLDAGSPDTHLSDGSPDASLSDLGSDESNLGMETDLDSGTASAAEDLGPE